MMEFKGMLDEALKPADRKLLDKYFLAYDNQLLLRLLTKSTPDSQGGAVFSREEMETLIHLLKEEEEVEKKQVPPYLEKIIREWLEEEKQDHLRSLEERGRELENRISSLYMDYGREVKNSLIAGWFEMNLNIGNLLSAIFARKYGMDVKQAIIGSNEIADIIREHAHTRDFGLEGELDYYDRIQRIAEDPDIYERERKIDQFRWDWLEENSVHDYFNIEYIFAYLCKLQILERWVQLNAEEGERVIRELIAQLKSQIK